MVVAEAAAAKAVAAWTRNPESPVGQRGSRDHNNTHEKSGCSCSTTACVQQHDKLSANGGIVRMFGSMHGLTNELRNACVCAVRSCSCVAGGLELVAVGG